MKKLKQYKRETEDEKLDASKLSKVPYLPSFAVVSKKFSKTPPGDHDVLRKKKDVR